jgi:hypothetical protein
MHQAAARAGGDGSLDEEGVSGGMDTEGEPSEHLQGAAGAGMDWEAAEAAAADTVNPVMCATCTTVVSVCVCIYQCVCVCVRVYDCVCVCVCVCV